VREETFQVRGQGPLRRKIYYTRNGWVAQVDLEEHRAFALALEGLDLLDSPTQLLTMNRARDIAVFKEALAMHRLPLWNIMAADSQGNLFYVYNAHLHRRSEAWGRAEWRPGWDPEARWSPEIIPFDELPQVENPESDWMQNNNVMPWLVTSGLEMEPEDYPSYLVKRGAGLNDRGRRASDVLSRARGWTPSDALALATDTLVPKAEEYVPRILSAFETAPPEEQGEVARAVEILRGWNLRADVDQPGMTLFYFWWRLPTREREEPLSALAAAISQMKGLYGSIELPWGEIHRIRRGELDLPIAGSRDPSTLWMAHGPVDRQGVMYCERAARPSPWSCNSAPGWRPTPSSPTARARTQSPPITPISCR